MADMKVWYWTEKKEKKNGFSKAKIRRAGKKKEREKKFVSFQSVLKIRLRWFTHEPKSILY